MEDSGRVYMRGEGPGGDPPPSLALLLSLLVPLPLMLLLCLPLHVHPWSFTHSLAPSFDRHCWHCSCGCGHYCCCCCCSFVCIHPVIDAATTVVSILAVISTAVTIAVAVMAVCTPTHAGPLVCVHPPCAHPLFHLYLFCLEYFTTSTCKSRLALIVIYLGLSAVAVQTVYTGP